MIKLPPKGVTTKGLDVSHYDETIDFGKVKAGGFEFCSAKATEGMTVVDSSYGQNKVKAQAAGVLFGAYHFFRPGSDPKRQADHFLRTAHIKPGDMVPMFDWEVSQGPGDVLKAKVFLDIVEREIGRKMIIYGPPYMLRSLRLGHEFKDHPLWVAHYQTKAPLVPEPWDNWTFWQYSDRGSVPGIPAANEDMDLFNGPVDGLKKLVV